MEDDFPIFETFIQKYNQFRENLEKKLKNPPAKIECEECYLIDNNNKWFDELLFNYKTYQENKNNDKFFPEQGPIFIQDIFEADNKIQNTTIVKRELLDILNHKMFTNQKVIFRFHIGGNKKLLIIIEDPKNDGYVLQIENPLYKPKNKILIQNNNKKNKISLIETIINDFNEDINNSLNNSINININIKLIILILIYYYEKYLINPENNFNQYQKYYCISNEWMNKFKKFINYDCLYKKLEEDDKKNKNKCNYQKLIFYLNNSNNNFFSQYSDYYESIQSVEDSSFLNISPFVNKYKLNNIEYLTRCYIIHSKIIEFIENNFINKKLDNPQKVISKNKNVYLLLNNKYINVGIFNNQLLFESKYIISYNSNELYENELERVLEMDFNDYLTINNCNPNNCNLQNLLENGIEKGKIIYLNSSNDLYFNQGKSSYLKFQNNRIKFINILLRKIFDMKYIHIIIKKLIIDILRFKQIRNKDRIIEEKNKRNKEFEYKLIESEQENKKLKDKINQLEHKNNEKEENIKKLEIELQKIKEENIKLINDIKYKKKEYYIQKIEKFEIKSINKNQIQKSELSEKNNISQIFMFQQKSIGLSYIGEICYMNSILQCFNHTKFLTNFFINEIDEIKNNENYYFSKIYLELIENLRNGCKSFEPYHFRNEIINRNQSFKESTPDKIGDFIKLLLDQLHNELKNKEKKNSSKKYINISTDYYVNRNQNEKNKMFEAFYENFNLEKSVISENFFGFKEMSYECLNPDCKNNEKFYNYELFKYIIFPLEEILNIKNAQNQDDENTKITINECFKISFDNKLFSGEKNYQCCNCKKYTKCKYESQIYQVPDILIIILKRDKNSIIDVELEFYDTIDITPFVLDNNYNELIYKLYGFTICNHENGANSQFNALCKNYLDNKWYIYEDTEIKEVYNFQEEFLENEIPYVLFYEKTKNCFTD